MHLQCISNVGDFDKNLPRVFFCLLCYTIPIISAEENLKYKEKR